MILTLDIGNTNIKTALFDGAEMAQYWRLSTDITCTSDVTRHSIVENIREL